MYCVSALQHQKENTDTDMIQSLFPPPPPLKLVKIGQIVHYWSLSSDKAPQHWTKNELSFFIPSRSANCLKLRDRGSKRKQRC